MGNPTDILRHPLITEKGTRMSGHNKVLFAVVKHANKHQIKQAVEEFYKVKVLKVNTITRLGKPKVVRSKPGYRADEKRAIVTLAPGSKIEIA